MNTAFLFSPKINVCILRPIYSTPPLSLYQFVNVIFELSSIRVAGLKSSAIISFKLQFHWLHSQVVAFHNDVGSDFEISLIACPPDITTIFIR